MTVIINSTLPASVHFPNTCMNNPATTSSTSSNSAKTSKPSDQPSKRNHLNQTEYDGQATNTKDRPLIRESQPNPHVKPFIPRRSGESSGSGRRQHASSSRIDDDEIVVDRSSTPVESRFENRRNKGKNVHQQSPPSESQQRAERARSARSEAQTQRASVASSRPRVAYSNDTDSVTGSGSRRPRAQRKDHPSRTLTSAARPTTHDQTVDAHQRRSSNITATKRNALRTPIKATQRTEECRDLMETLTVGLTDSTYECMVCWDAIRPAHKIWSCQVCWAAFHINCLSTWAKKSSAGMSLNPANLPSSDLTLMILTTS